LQLTSVPFGGATPPTFFTDTLRLPVDAETENVQVELGSVPHEFLATTYHWYVVPALTLTTRLVPAWFPTKLAVGVPK